MHNSLDIANIDRFRQAAKPGVTTAPTQVSRAGAITKQPSGKFTPSFLDPFQPEW